MRKTINGIEFSGESEELISVAAMPLEEARKKRLELEWLGHEASFAPDGEDPTIAWIYVTEGDGLHGFAVEVETGFEGRTTWAGNALVFPSEEAAKIYGVDLLMRWTVPSDFRVIPVDRAPTHMFVSGDDGSIRMVRIEEHGNG